MKKTAMIAVFVGMQIVLAAYTANAGVPVTVPEPASLMLLSTGAAAVAIGVWWRNRK